MKIRVLSSLLLTALVFRSGAAHGTPVEFAAEEISAAAKAVSVAGPRVVFKIDSALGAQAYRLNRGPDGTVVVTGGDASGAMYGGLDIAEGLRLGTLDELVSDRRLHTPHILDRGIKFNVPLDFRTPTYSDRNTSSQDNIPEMWSTDFWHEFIDEMARDRYNVLSLWSEHPFPSMVKVPEFPDVALNDVWQGKTDAKGAYTDHIVVKQMTMDEKIAFWREVMQYAHDRGVAVYIFTWNVFTHAATGKYGITDAMSNATTVAYMRDSVRELIKTYPLLDGMGITSGENMPGATDDAKENWIWSTYGEGARDALRANPKRKFHIIHRFHQTSVSQIMQHWKDYPGLCFYKFGGYGPASARNTRFLGECNRDFALVEKENGGRSEDSLTQPLLRLRLELNCCSRSSAVLWLGIVRRRRRRRLRGRRQVLGEIVVDRGQVIIRRIHPFSDHIVDDVTPLIGCMSLLVPTVKAVAIAAQVDSCIPALAFRQEGHITTLRLLARGRGSSRRARLRRCLQEQQQLR